MSEVSNPDTNSSLPVWSCKLNSQAQAGEFTVGEIAELTCSGEKPVEFGKGKLAIHFPDEYKFSLHMYDLVDIKSNEITFKAVSYRVGKWDLSQMEILEDGTAKLKLSGIVYPVKSIQDPQKARKEPFGPADPFLLSWPSYIYAVGFIVVALILGSIFLMITKNVRKRAWDRKVSKYDSPMQPYHQFQKDLRVIRREFDFTQNKKWDSGQIKKYIDELDKFFKLFVLREFRVPALDWKPKTVLREIKKRKKRKFYIFDKKLSQVFNELERAQKSPDLVRPEDCQKLMTLCRDTSTAIWKANMAGGGR